MKHNDLEAMIYRMELTCDEVEDILETKIFLDQELDKPYHQ